MQLLASCFTQPRNMNVLTLPSGLYSYNERIQIDENRLSARPVSSLRQHMQWKHSPASGHQARRNSAVSLLPEMDDSLSRKARLAEHISFKWPMRQKQNRRRHGEH